MQTGKRFLAVLLIVALLIGCAGTLTTAMAAPGAVTGLTAKQKGTNSVTLSWNAASGAEKYQISRATSSGGPWKGVKSVTGTSTTTTDGISVGNTYYFKVQAFTEGPGGERYYGGESNIASVKINAAGTVGQATNLQVTVSGTTAKLSWNAAANATKYEVQRSKSSSSGFVSQKAVSGTSTDNSNLETGTTYYYRIMPFKEVDGKRVYGTASGVVSVKTAGTPTPTGPVGMATGLVLSSKGTTVYLSWKAATNATKYEIQRSETSGSGFKSQKSVTGTTAENYNLTKGKTYYYRIMPYKEVDGKRVYGSASGEKHIKITESSSAIGTVTGLRVVGVGASTVTLEWKAAPNAVYYEVRRSTSPTGPFKSQKSVTGTSTTNNVPDTGIYYYQICGYVIKSDNTRSYGDPSDVVKATVGTPTAIGSIPSISVTKKTGTVVTVSWKPAENANQYTLYACKGSSSYIKKGSTDKTSIDCEVGTSGGTFHFKVLPSYQVNGITKTEGGFSGIASIKMDKATIGKVAGLSAKCNEKEVTLSWNAAANAAHYQVCISTSMDGTYKGVKPVDTLTTKTNPGSYGTHYYKVRGFVYDLNGNRVYGPYSSGLKVIVLDGVTITKIYADKINVINLEWNDVSFEHDGFEVYRKAEGQTKWELLPKTHIKGTPGGKYTFYDDTVVPGMSYQYSVATYVMSNGAKKTSKIGKNAKSLSTSIAATTIKAGYGISTSEGIYISWNDIQDIDNWQVQYSTSIDSGFVELALVDESTFADYEKGKIRSSGVYLKTTGLQNGIAYYIRVRGISTLNGATVYGTWSKPRLVSAPSVTLRDVTTMKESASVYLNVVNNGGLYMYLPSSAKYWTDGDDITTQYAITISGSTEVKPYQEITSQRYTFSDGTERKPSSSSMFAITFKYNGYSYTIQPGRGGESFWRITN